MGSSITVHAGIKLAHPKSRTVAVIGDSTFIHSGITGLINSVYNRAKGVLIILDNGTTAMTGGQDHPGSGKTLLQESTHKLNLEQLCRATGADSVDVINPRHEVPFKKLLQKRMTENSYSVIIAQSPCTLMAQRESRGKTK